LARYKQTRRDISIITVFARPSSLISIHANMFSLLCRTTSQVQFSLFNSVALPVVITGRAQSTSTTGPEWTPTHQYASKSSECNARRYATDPEYRERQLARVKAWTEKNRVARGDYLRMWRMKNPDKQKAITIRSKSTLDYEKLYYARKRARWASDDHYKQREIMRNWLSLKPWVQRLTWQTHRPTVSEKTVHYCSGCEINRSLKLWWQDNKTDEFLCHPCFTSDWSRALPIGYEDKVFGRRQNKSSKTTAESKPGADP
jgi:hypothetical protein